MKANVRNEKVMVLRMDKQYIDRHEAYMLIRNEAGTHELPASKEAYERAARIVAQMRPENIAIMEQKIGRWINIRPLLTAARCSECKSAFAEKTNFCPYCGAKMEGETE